MRAGAAFTPYAGTPSGRPGGRSSTRARRPSTSCAVRDALAPEYCRCGAATTTSHPAARATSASTVSPSDWMPSSFVMSTRISALLLLRARRVGRGGGRDRRPGVARPPRVVAFEVGNADPSGEPLVLLPATRAQAPARYVEGLGRGPQPGRLDDDRPASERDCHPRGHRVARAAVVQRGDDRADEQARGLLGDEQGGLTRAGDEHRPHPLGDEPVARLLELLDGVPLRQPGRLELLVAHP